jgi:D-alanyl-D-alanine carboxypeptidase (penicillin-binding protein 5/6)
LTLVASVLGADSEYERDRSTLALLDWGFSNFEQATPVKVDQVFARAHVPYELLPAVLVAARGYSTVIAKGTRVEVTVGRLRDLSPPMAAGTDVGYLKVEIAGRPTVHIALVLERSLPSVPALKKVVHVLLRPITLLLLALLVGSITAALALRSRRRRRRDTSRSRVRAPRHLEER